MKFTEESIKKQFDEHTTLKVVFIKKDKSLREMRCTRDLGLIPDEHHPKGSTKVQPPGLLNVYELGVGWRSFHCDNVVEVTPELGVRIE